jgi:hypothetical protein
MAPEWYSWRNMNDGLLNIAVDVSSLIEDADVSCLENMTRFRAFEGVDEYFFDGVLVSSSIVVGTTLGSAVISGVLESERLMLGIVVVSSVLVIWLLVVSMNDDSLKGSSSHLSSVFPLSGRKDNGSSSKPSISSSSIKYHHY